MKNPVHPGQLVRDAIVDGLGLTITAAAEGLGLSRKQLSAIINGRASITPEIAVRLEMGIGSTADQWIRMQTAFDFARIRKKNLKVKKFTKLEAA